MSSMRALIHDLREKAKSREELAQLVYKNLDETQREETSLSTIRRAISIELKDPNQMEFLIESEPFPLEEVPTELLQARANRIRAQIITLQTRLEACLTEIKARQNAKGAR